MNRRTLMIATVISIILSGSASFAQSHTHDGTKVISTPKDVQWQPAPAIFPEEMKIAYLYGDLGKHEPFTIRVMMPAHSVIAPHTHNLDEMLTIISGDLDHYTGPKMNPSEGLHMEAGGFVHLPVNMGHALKAGDSGVILQVSGVGPFGMTYIDLKDDPRHK
ncbi:cupin domain-containing protein [Gluconobacter kondonii]|uniref:cupin domain-containing protein n=1 Tax=Gluconobacter kondonii TaxID=941463 RepID=UPI001B8BCB62|nr:cupin domain-containing protein [Gluconobacter kondonii]MBS1081668.1 cupin domain-containing protein [Gluconobacter kondonii]